MENARIGYLLDRYATDDITASENAELMNFLSRPESHAVAIVLMEKYWDKSGDVVLDKDRADQIFNSLIGQQAGRRVRIFSPWMGWAASFFILFAISIFLYRSSDESGSGKNRTAANITALSGSVHKKIILPDGSSVILNDNSTLSYPQEFLGSSREVVLSGEGYFDISHDADKPFIVHTGNVKTTVLGTAFNIKALAGRPVLVTVTRGKVSVRENDRLLGILVPDQQISYAANSKKAEKLQVLAKEAISWQENDLFFEDVSMAEAADILSKKYNVEIQFENNLGKNCRFTATFLKAQGLDEILKVITSFNGATYETSAGRILIRAKDCQN